MEHKDFLSGNCPKCGEKLEIPAHLDAFSCLYCGARLTAEDLNKKAETVTSTDAEAAANYYKENILQVITAHREIEKSLTRNAYEPAMDAYAEQCGQVFVQLDAACAGGALTVREAAKWLLDRLEEHWVLDLKKKKLGQTASSLRDGDKFLIAVFLVPMIQRLGLGYIPDFCKALHEEWMTRFPKSPWQVGDFDSINSGFRKKFLGLCFITTAVCLEEGKEDDCAELTAFRNFRDGYLRSCPDGTALIEEYYRIAPNIVLEIEKSADPKARYAAIRKDYLQPCYEDLQSGRQEQCKLRYTKMVRSLQKEYLS